jgi:hypothetical protein
MITAIFHTWRGGTSVAIGPRPYFRVEGGRLYGGGDGTPLATYDSGTWDIASHGSFVRFRFDHPVCVDLEHRDGTNRCLGKMPEMVVIDGALYTGPDLMLLMLRFSDRLNQWYCYADERRYDILRFESGPCS